MSSGTADPEHKTGQLQTSITAVDYSIQALSGTFQALVSSKKSYGNGQTM